MSKRFDVTKFRVLINGKLLLPTLTQDQKAVLCSVLEEVLHETDNYHGFNWSAWLDGGFDQWFEAGKPDNVKPFCGLEYNRVYFGAPGKKPAECETEDELDKLYPMRIRMFSSQPFASTNPNDIN